MSNRWIVLALVFLTRTSMGFQFQSVGSSAPLLVAELGLTYAQLGTLIGLYMLPGAFFALPGGVIGRRLGERRVVIAGLALMVVGGVVTAAAGSFATAIAGRVVSGVGAVVMNILLAKIVSDWFAGKELSTALGIMLTSWPVGLGLATATLSGVAAGHGWRTAVMATAAVAGLGLLLMLICRDAPGGTAGPTRVALRGRDLRLALASGFASLAIWVTMLSVPLGGLLTDRLGRPTLMIVTGSLIAAATTLLIPVLAHSMLAFCLVGLAIGAPPGGLMALLPRTLPSERLTTGFGVFYTVFYVMMALTQPAAGLVRDLAGDPAAPIVFAALVMAATVVGLAAFHRIERAA